MTIGDLIDRLYRDYLSNPSDTPVQAKLQAAITDVQTTVVYADELVTEEKALIGVGTIIEAGLELMRVTAHNESTRTLTVTRGVYGSTAAAHGSTTLMRVAPKWPRVSVFEAIADEVSNLYPDLYGTDDEWASSKELMVPIENPNAAELLSVKQLVAGHYEDISAQMIRTNAVSSGIAVQFTPRFTHSSDGDVWIRYTTSFSRPTTEADTFASLGVDESWARILLMGAISSLLPQADMDAATQEFITEAMENEGFPPTTATSLAVALARTRADLIGRARRKLRSIDNVRVQMRQVL